MGGFNLSNPPQKCPNLLLQVHPNGFYKLLQPGIEPTTFWSEFRHFPHVIQAYYISTLQLTTILPGAEAACLDTVLYDGLPVAKTIFQLCHTLLSLPDILASANNFKTLNRQTLCFQKNLKLAPQDLHTVEEMCTVQDYGTYAVFNLLYSWPQYRDGESQRKETE